MHDQTCCHRTTLACGPAGLVQLCGCGAVHLSVGPVTMRLTPQACESLSRTLADAAGQLRRELGRRAQDRQDRRTAVVILIDRLSALVRRMILVPATRSPTG